MKKFGLIGHPLGHSWSQRWFEAEFSWLGILDAQYRPYDIEASTVDSLRAWALGLGLAGFNVTAPYKEQVIPQLHDLDTAAAAIGAVNCVEVRNGRLIGHNTDAPAFRETLLPLLPHPVPDALVLGTGGAAKAVAHALQEMGIRPQLVSRTPEKHPCSISYAAAAERLAHIPLLVNCTPLGTAGDPATEGLSPWPRPELITPQHRCYDLVYNPAQTPFLHAAAARGARTCNGLAMLERQARLSWEIWGL